MTQLCIYMRAFIRVTLRPIAVTTVFAILSSLSQQAWAQQPERGARPLSQAQFDQMLAPIALYPDNLLAQILTAAGHPSEIETAARWSAANPRILGQALANAMHLQPWDPSVKALTAVPQVLKMMNEKLGWTMLLGKAYLSQPQNITFTVQRLRAFAEATGNLKSSGQIHVERIAVEQPIAEIGPQYIVIKPAYPDRIFVPVYDPTLIYGDWPYPLNRPFVWTPPGYVAQEAFGFGPAVLVGTALWATFNWNKGQVSINPGMYSNFNKVPIAQALELSASSVKFNPGQRADVGFGNQNPNTQFRSSALGDGRTTPLSNTTNTGTGQNLNTGTGQNFTSNPGSQRGNVMPSGGTAGSGFSTSNVVNRDTTNNPGRIGDSVNSGTGINRGINNGGNPTVPKSGAATSPGKVSDTTIGGAGLQTIRGSKITKTTRPVTGTGTDKPVTTASKPVTSTSKPITSMNKSVTSANKHVTNTNSPPRTASNAVTTNTNRTKVVTNGTRRRH